MIKSSHKGTSVFGSELNKRNFDRFYVELLIQKVNKRKANTIHPKGTCLGNLLGIYKDEIDANNGLVWAENYPWLEAMLLAHGASQLTTLHYGKLKINHTQIQVYTPYDFANKYLNSDINQFDFGVSFSSVEHSGLDRYADPLNPYGDLNWCMTKPGALFILGVPCSNDHSDCIVWNAHRVYGSKRLQHLSANWQVLQIVICKDFYNILVLRKRNATSDSYV